MVQLNNSFSGFHLFSVRFGFIIVCHPEHVHASDAICNHISKHTHTHLLLNVQIDRKCEHNMCL